MKGYKLLIPIGLVGGMGIAWYSMINTVQSNQQEYKKYIEQGDQYASQDILIDALENYESAIAIKDSVNLRLKIVDLYITQKEIEEAEKYADTVMTKFSGNSAVYEKMMSYYIKNSQYTEAFALYDRAKSAGAVSDVLKENYRSIQYEYYIQDNGYTVVSNYINGMCAVSLDGSWSYVSETGESILSGNLEAATSFMEDFAVARILKEDGTSEWQLIDSGGNKRRSMPEDIEIEEAGSFSGGVYVLKDSIGRYVYVKKNGDIWKEGFSFAGPMLEGFAVVADSTGYHLLNTEGESKGGSFERIAVDDINIGVRNGCFFGKRNDQYLLYDTEGKQVSSASFQEARPFAEEDGYAAVKVDGKWGFIDGKGNMVIEPQYEDARSFSNGYAAVKSQNLWGFIDTNNETCIEPAFSEAKDFNAGGNVFIKKNGVWSLLLLYSHNYK